MVRIRDIQHLLRGNGNSLLAIARRPEGQAPDGGQRHARLANRERLFEPAGRAEGPLEKARQAGAAERRATALYEISKALTSSLELRPMLRELCRQAASAFDGSGAGVWLLQPDGMLVQTEGWGFSPEQLARIRELRIPLDSHNVATVARKTGETQVVFDALNDNRTSPALIELYRWRSMIVAPVITNGQTAGVLGLGHGEPEHFTVEDRETAGLLASQVAVAITRAQEYEELKARNRMAEIEARVATAASGSLELEAVLQTICDESAAALAVDRVSIWLVDGSGTLVRAAEAGTPAPPGVRRELPLSGALAHDVPLGKGLRLSQLRLDPTHALDQQAELIAQYGVADFVVVPFGRARKLAGILAIVDLHDPARFRENDVEVAEVIARHAELAIANALAYRDQREAIQRLDELNQMKTSFLSIMRHELRTPLNAILGFSDLLQKQAAGELTPKQSRYVDNIQQAGQRLLHLIEDILEYSNVQSRDQLEQEQIDVGPLLEEVTATFQSSAAAKGVGLTVQVEPGLAPIIGDRARLGRGLRRLIDNAIKFTEPAGRVVVNGSRRDRSVTIAVQDTGCGIAPQDQERIFQPFVQVDSSASRSFEGSGLGLAIVARIAELHGGSVAVESAVGRGSTFRLHLPIRAEEAA